MNRKLAEELKAAGFPMRFYQTGHKFYPHEKSAGWSEASRKNGVTITPYDLQNHLQDIEDGYYCPTLTDLIEACGNGFARLFVEKTIWTAQGKDPEQYALADSPEEAVARLWFALHKKSSNDARHAAECR